MREATQVVLAVGPIPLLFLLGRSKGVLWRVSELPGLIAHRAKWAIAGLGSRVDRALVRATVTLAYLCSTVSVTIDTLTERLRPLLLDPATHDQGRQETKEFLRSQSVRPPAITLWALLVSLLGWLTGSLMMWTHDNGAAMGHLTTPYVMALVAISMARFDGKNLTIDDEGGTLGPFMVAVRMVFIGSVAALVTVQGWSDGSIVAEVLGTMGLLCAALGGATPVRRWLRKGTYTGWRAHVLGRAMLIGSTLCGGATIVELCTSRAPISALFVVSSMLGAIALIGAAAVFALLGADPPGPCELELVAQGAGPGDGGTTPL
jgi:hypothetical protein